MPKRGDKEFLIDMLTAGEKIMKYTNNLTYEDFRKNELIIDAIMRNIEIIG